MVQKTLKRRVGRGVNAPNKIRESELANGIINMKFSDDWFMKARSVALAKNPQLKTNPEILNFILSDYFQLHQIEVKVDVRKIA